MLAGIGLTGTKLGCGEGGCGACTVMVSSWEGDAILHRSINACLCPVYAVEGMHVITVEGVRAVHALPVPYGRCALCILAGAAPGNRTSRLLGSLFLDDWDGRL